MIAFKPMVVASEKKFHMLMPKSSTKGNVGVPSVNFRNLTNTTYITQNNIRGFNTDHAMPRKDP